MNQNERERIIADLTNVLIWLDHLSQAIGEDRLLEAMPHNWSGRVSLRRLLTDLETTIEKEQLCGHW